MPFERRLIVDRNNDRRELCISIAYPTRCACDEVADGNIEIWEAEIIISGDSELESRLVARNVDAISTLIAAFVAIRNHIDKIDGEIFWLVPGDNGGFPLMVIQAFGRDITKRQESALRAEFESAFTKTAS